MHLTWNKCQGDVWCPFLTVNIAHPHLTGMHGVYIIWHGGSAARTVYVGRGHIPDRIRAHRQEPRITQYSSLGMYVTWARLAANEQPAVESFLIQKLRPLANQVNPLAIPVEVNLPW